MKRLLSVFIDHRLLKNFGCHSNWWLRTTEHVPTGCWKISNKMDHSAANPNLVNQNSILGTHRRWEPVPGKRDKGSRSSSNAKTPGNGPGARDRIEFTLMNYNILAQDLLDSHAQLYSQHDPQALPWKERSKRLTAEIETINPDILCVQELQENHIETFCSRLKQDYAMLYKKRTGGDKTDGCALFYRRDLFDLVSDHKVEFYQPNVNKLNRENVAIIAKLALKANPRAKLVVSTTHLLYNPNRQDIRLAQIQVLLAELDRFAYSGRLLNGLPQYDPIILCGDFNLQPFSAPYQLLINGFLRYDRLEQRSLKASNQRRGEKIGKCFLPPALGITDSCQHSALKDREKDHRDQVPPSHMTKLHHSNHHAAKPTTNEAESSIANVPPTETEGRGVFSSGSLHHRFVLNSAYRHFQDDGEDQQNATTFQNEWITVDYMFYTPYRSVAECNRKLPNWNLELLKTYALPTVQQCCWEIGCIPNKVYGSDHFALAGHFLLTIPKEEQ
ncbi:protein angel [Anopheles maculipalpis]|uniref:protein angel n=1 Tax=Anopheles maculipalpis TaxID=1496333 RepID=UPI002159B1CC|nr:protein angel [Anopheles maculipalpis]